MNYSILKTIIAYSLFLCFFFIPGKIYSQEISLSISPPITHIITKAGQTIPFRYTIVNYGDPTLVDIKVYRLSYVDSQATPKISSIEKNNLIQFDALDNEPFLFLSKQAYEGTTTLTIDKQVPEGDYYFTIIAESIKTDGFETSSDIQLQAAVASNIYISVNNSGNLQSNLKINQFSIKPTFTFNIFGTNLNVVDSGKTIPVTLIISNNGPHVASFMTNVTMSSRFSFVRDNDYSAQIKNQLLPINTQRKIHLSEIPPQFIGIYKMNTSIESINSNIIYENTSFIVFPVKILIYTISISFISLLIALFRSRYSNT